jgi:hypothetical protein
MTRQEQRHVTTNEQKAAEHKAVTDAIDALLRAANDGELLTCESMTDLADKIKRAEYWRHVRVLADEVKENATRRVREDGDDANEAVSECLHEAVDGSAWVIYTRRNFDVLRYSENDDAALGMGVESIATRDGVNWAALAYCALEADVCDQLSDLVNELESPADDEAAETEA